MTATTYYTPDGLYAVDTAGAAATRQDGTAEGERRRDAAHDLLRDRRAVWVRRAQRALLAAAINAGTATADDVAAAVDLPRDLDGRLLGAAPGALVRAGLLGPRGYVRSARPTRHASVLAVWGLTDRDAAIQWLATHPDCETCRQCGEGALDRDANDETPTVAAAGVSF